MAPLNGTLVLFGGETFGGANLADTWTWDGHQWTALDVVGPPPRWQAVMAPVDGALVLFGGVMGYGPIFADTWTWDGVAWTLLGVTAPPGRDQAVMTSL
jgi:hypothetical protein